MRGRGGRIAGWLDCGLGKDTTVRIADWKEYELIDTSAGERLERWGDVILIRPDPQVLWHTKRENPLWRKADAIYKRSRSGGGSWTVCNIPDTWNIS